MSPNRARRRARGNRRTFLAGAAGAGVVALTGNWRNALGQSPREVARGGVFAQSVASGQPSTDGITLWTKLSQLERPGLIQYEVATEPDFRSIVARHSILPSSADDFAVTTRLQSAKLRPGEQYFYRFLTCDRSSPIGRFRTARPADSNEPIRVAFFSCQDYEPGFYTAHAGLAEEQDLDLVVCLGDYIYERSFDTSPRRKDTTGANRDAEVQTLPEYRDKYRLYHTDPNLLRVRETHPMLAIWDDHEVEDNYAGERAGDATQSPRVPFGQRRANGYRAYFEHMPRVRDASPDRIYGRTVLGRHCELLLLDQRQYRSDQPCDDATATPCPESRDAGRTLLGAEQKEWLKGALASSTASWKIVGNQLMIMALDTEPTGNSSFTYDSWDGYKAERQELLDFVKARSIKDVSFVTGDIHTFFAGDVAPSGRAGVSDPSVATEFVGGSITSEGIVDGRSGGAAPVLALPADAVVMGSNPHIKFANQEFKGYAVLEARPDELLVQYKSPQSTQQERSTMRTLRPFRVARGTPSVQVLPA